MDGRKPLAKVMESKEPYMLRLKPSEIARVRALALARGVGHTTLAREFFLRGMRMAQLEELEKGDTRVTA